MENPLTDNQTDEMESAAKLLIAGVRIAGSNKGVIDIEDLTSEKEGELGTWKITVQRQDAKFSWLIWEALKIVWNLIFKKSA